MKLMGTGSPEVRSTNERRASIPLKPSPGYWARSRLPYVSLPFSIITTMLTDYAQIDRMNLE